MSKPLIGIVLGAVLGAIDGLTAWFTPAVRDQNRRRGDSFHPRQVAA